MTPIGNNQLIQLKPQLDRNGSKSQKVLLQNSDYVVQEHLGLGRFKKVGFFCCTLTWVVSSSHVTQYHTLLREKLTFKTEPKTWHHTALAFCITIHLLAILHILPLETAAMSSSTPTKRTRTSSSSQELFILGLGFLGYGSSHFIHGRLS